MSKPKRFATATILAGALASLAIMISTTAAPASMSDIVVTIGLYVWVMVPFVVLLGWTLLVYRRGHSLAARRAIVVTDVLVVAAAVFLYWDAIFRSDSSTSALVFLFVPIYSLIAIGSTDVIAWLVFKVIGRVSAE